MVEDTHFPNLPGKDVKSFMKKVHLHKTHGLDGTSPVLRTKGCVHTRERPPELLFNISFEEGSVPR